MWKKWPPTYIYTVIHNIGSNRSRPPGSQGFTFFGQKTSQDYQLFIHIQGCRLSGFFRIRNTKKSVIRILQNKNFFSKIHNDKKTQLFFKTYLFRKNCPRLLQIIVTLLIYIKKLFFSSGFFCYRLSGSGSIQMKSWILIFLILRVSALYTVYIQYMHCLGKKTSNMDKNRKISSSVTASNMDKNRKIFLQSMSQQYEQEQEDFQQCNSQQYEQEQEDFLTVCSQHYEQEQEDFLTVQQPTI